MTKTKALPDYPVTKADRLQEARAQITYFKNMIPALEYAIKKMKNDLSLCNKNVVIWEKRIAALEGPKGGVGS